MNEETLNSQEERDAEEYLKRHPNIYQMFAHFTWEAILAGAKDFGARAVLERMRWETNVRGDKADFKLNNNLTPFLARKFMRENPQVGEIFETRSGRKVGLIEKAEAVQ